MSDDERCERPACTLPARWFRFVADPNTRGVNMNEPGMKRELLCTPHAIEVKIYVGGQLFRLSEPEERP